MEMPDHIIHLLEFIDHDMDRFWTRFNIFTAIQVAAVVGFISNAKFFAAPPHDSNANRLVLRFSFLLMIAFSFCGFIIVYSGHTSQHALLKTLDDFEAKAANEGAQHVAAANATNHTYHRLLHTVEANRDWWPTFTSRHTNSTFAYLFALLCLAYWLAAWLWMDCCRGYTRLNLSRCNDNK